MALRNLEKIFIASDHGGYSLKERILKNITLSDNVDYDDNFLHIM